MQLADIAISSLSKSPNRTKQDEGPYTSAHSVCIIVKPNFMYFYARHRQNLQGRYFLLPMLTSSLLFLRKTLGV